MSLMLATTKVPRRKNRPYTWYTLRSRANSSTGLAGRATARQGGGGTRVFRKRFAAGPPWRPVRPLRLLALAAAAATLLAGCATPAPPGGGNGTAAPPAAPGTPAADAPLQWGHEHATFALFILGERVSFNHVDYDLSRVRVMRAHLHVPDEFTIHIEDDFPGGIPTVTVAEFLGVHGVRFATGALTLDRKDGHNGTTWNDTAQARWHVLVEPANQTAAEAAAGPGHVLREGQRVLVSYAPPGTDFAPQFAAFPAPKSPTRPAP